MAIEEGYVSKYLTHFVGKGKPPDEQFALLKRILSRHWLTHPPHLEQPTLTMEIRRSNNFSENDMFMPGMICFCDIPEAHLRIHTQKYGQFGIAFPKSYLVAQGANPVLYVARNSTARRRKREFRKDHVSKSTITAEEYATLKNQPADTAKFQDEPRSALFDEHVKELFDLWYEKEKFEAGEAGEVVARIMNRDKLMWTFFLQHLLGFVKFFDDTLKLDHADNFYMEREWRRFGSLNFGTGDDCRHSVGPHDWARDARYPSATRLGTGCPRA